MTCIKQLICLIECLLPPNWNIKQQGEGAEGGRAPGWGEGYGFIYCPNHAKHETGIYNIVLWATERGGLEGEEGDWKGQKERVKEREVWAREGGNRGARGNRKEDHSQCQRCWVKNRESEKRLRERRGKGEIRWMKWGGKLVSESIESLGRASTTPQYIIKDLEKKSLTDFVF